jgi:hypothetical protein
MKIKNVLPLIILLTISGCTLEPTCHLYNNTGKEISIEQVFTDGKTKKYGLKPGGMEPIRDWGWSKIQIKIINGENKLAKTWKYEKPREPSNEHWKWRGWWIFARNYFDAQIESNGIVIALNKEQKYPIRPEQGLYQIKPEN